MAEFMPPAKLEERDNDVKIGLNQFLEISLFQQLKNKIKENKWPGAMAVRRYHKGDVICRQGEAGWTAFYLLTTEDMFRLGKYGLAQLAAAAPAERAEIQNEVTIVSQRLSLIRTGSDSEKLRTVATVHLTIPKAGRPKSGGLLANLFGGKPKTRARPESIPIDGPTEVSATTLTAVLHEGELFGEMSCLYRTPRSATIIAARDCYVLEILRNILDKIKSDPDYRKIIDQKYRESVLQLHLRKLSLFSDLDDRQYKLLRDNLELLSFETGKIICDEHERSDGLLIVRSGLIKVVKKRSPLLHVDSVRDWAKLMAAVREGESQPATPRGQVWKLLPESAKAILRAADAAAPGDKEKQEVLYGLNDVIKLPALLEAKECAPLVTADLKKQVEDPDNPRVLPPKPSAWSDQEARLANRFLFEKIFDPILRGHRRRVGPEAVLSYCARGDVIGEVGVLEGTPRSATCLAFGHPADIKLKEPSLVELVRIPTALVEKLLETSPKVRQRLEALKTERQRQTKAMLPSNVTEDPSDVLLSKRFQDLGLIQGQRLMLIDLDRCTRCDECVRACVNTHDDGYSRLFLDGNRFEKYLVPVTCRSCLDPVCMIGCPVGSIHRGDNGQIVIEDWCIGCGLCAKGCPYGSIHMHDIGVVAEAARGWRYTSEARVPGEAWVQPRYSDKKWATGATPFVFDREFRGHLAAHFATFKDASLARTGPIAFRYEFQVSGDLLRPDAEFTAELTSTDDGARIWVNGVELKTDAKPKRGKREFSMGHKEGEANPLRAGRNVLAVLAMPKPDDATSPLMTVRLDAVQKPDTTAAGVADEGTQKQVTEKAVVCDLCSDSFGKVPACVNACPHDAAMRVDARFDFPIR